MTVAVACNLAEGVILGVDSAITMDDGQGHVVKTYENATKLFQLGKKPIGIATFGLGALGNRIIGICLREFEKQDPQGVVTKDASLEETVEQLRQFFFEEYNRVVVPGIEQKNQKKFAEIPEANKPILGLAVGGFSSGKYLSEVWQILIPQNTSTKSAMRWCEEGNFRSVWFALNDPIFRYHKGYDRNLLNEVIGCLSQARGKPLSDTENKTIEGILLKHEYQIPFSGMPIDEGVAYVKFLVEMVINHHRFSVGAPVVGGKVQIGVVTYKSGQFRILNPSNLSLSIPDNVMS